jgi:hypothetical protein
MPSHSASSGSRQTGLLARLYPFGPVALIALLSIGSALADVRCCYRGLVILSYKIGVAVNLEGDYGKSRERASAASY